MGLSKLFRGPQTSCNWGPSFARFIRAVGQVTKVGLWEKSPRSVEAMGAPGVCSVRQWVHAGPSQGRSVDQAVVGWHNWKVGTDSPAVGLSVGHRVMGGRVRGSNMLSWREGHD